MLKEIGIQCEIQQLQDNIHQQHAVLAKKMRQAVVLSKKYQALECLPPKLSESSA